MEIAIALIEKENLVSSIKVVNTDKSYTELTVSSLDIKSVNVRFYTDVLADEVEEDAPVEEVIEVTETQEETSIETSVQKVAETTEPTQVELVEVSEVDEEKGETEEKFIDKIFAIITDNSNEDEVPTTEFTPTPELLQLSSISKDRELLNVYSSSSIKQQSSIVLYKQYILKAKEKYY